MNNKLLVEYSCVVNTMAEFKQSKHCAIGSLLAQARKAVLYSTTTQLARNTLFRKPAILSEREVVPNSMPAYFWTHPLFLSLLSLQANCFM